MRSGVKSILFNKSEWQKLTLACKFSAFLVATVRAGVEMSQAVMLASGSFLARVMAMQPEPVPTSRIAGCSGRTRLVGLTPGK